MKKLILAALSLSVALTSTSATAAFVVDTGPGTVRNGGIGLSDKLAGYFTLDSDTVVNSVEGWIGGNEGGLVTVSIFSGHQFPETSLFSDSFAAVSTPFNGGGAWQGVSGHSWTLASGSYWVVFESTGPQFMPDGNVPNPLSRYAFFADANGRWFDISNKLGVRIASDLAGAVPEPATWAFMIFGFGAIGGAMRRQRKANVNVSYA